MFNTHVSRLVVPLFVMCFVGCGSGEIQRTKVSGTATFDGLPIVAGYIEFVPATGHTAPPGFAAIVDGMYDTSAEGSRGILPGPHSVRVTAYAEKPPEGDMEDEEALADEPLIEPLFSGYSIEADIQDSHYDIDVPAEAEGFGKSSGSKRGSSDDP